VTTPILRILYGPPGTGKTWRAARDAVRLIEPGIAEQDISARHKSMVSSGQIVWVTFHPSYSYEDFVEGFRPEITEKGILYAPRSGPFKAACDNITLSMPSDPTFEVGQQLTSTTQQKYEVVSASPDSVVVRNIKKGKGHGLLTPVSLHVIERLTNIGYKPGDLSLPGAKHEEKSEIADKVGYDMQTLFGMTGPLRAVWEHLNSMAPAPAKRRPVVLVIDELNRADLSRVFGELITLIEPDKRLGAPEERRVLLPYSQKLFGVPEELHILGTMNTADQSLSVMDTALRRRFEFVEVLPDPLLCAFPYGGVDLRKILTKWNSAIGVLESREKRIGHSYLHRERLEQIRAGSRFGDSPDGQLRTVAAAIQGSILPLLLESFRGDWRKADVVFGHDFDRGEGGLLEEVDDHDVRRRTGEAVDADTTSSYLIPDWWNPRHAVWDPDRFRAIIMSGIDAS
jgi:5-methylcytosine-specific restriction protein B